MLSLTTEGGEIEVRILVGELGTLPYYPLELYTSVLITLMVLGIKKVIFAESVPAFAWRENGKPFCKKKDRDSNLNLTMIGSLVYCESNTLVHVATEAEIARDHLQRTCHHTVIGGIISPVHDGYGKKDLESATHRCNMTRLALQSSDWIRLSEWECHQDTWSRTKVVMQYHQCHDKLLKDILNLTEGSIHQASFLRITGYPTEHSRGAKLPEERKMNTPIPDLGLQNTPVPDLGLQNTPVPDLGLQNTLVPDLGLQNTPVPDLGLQNTPFPDLGLQNTPTRPPEHSYHQSVRAAILDQ
uniref:Uncharacterized protein n=1 Tax=Timema bartmani TaxID=61472 RepID=A0A7R9F1M0_9NEOP|nr:unnamed protein product [Timema bartmani]